MLIAQITDCHIVDDGELMVDRVDSAATLAAVVNAVNSFRPRIDLVIATGDLVNDGTSSQYDRLLRLLDRLEPALLPVAGNHDDRTELRARFSDVVPAGGAADPIDYVVDSHPVRLVVLDTTIPGEHRGRLAADQLGWLDAALSERPEAPTLLIQHHPPFATGIGFMDAYRLEGAAEQARVVARHPQVEALVSGHIHRVVQQRFGGTVASCWPSTAAQVALELGGGRVAYTDEPPAFAVHRWTPSDGLVSHLVPVVEHERWTPNWALGADGG